MEFIHLSISFVPFCFSLRLYRFVGYLLFPFCIKEEYKTGDGSTNRVADQQYIVKQNVHKFSSSPFYFQRLVANPFYFDFFYYTFLFLFFVVIPFMKIHSTPRYVTLNF
jgi:hypothetical protein